MERRGGLGPDLFGARGGGGCDRAFGREGFFNGSGLREVDRREGFEGGTGEEVSLKETDVLAGEPGIFGEGFNAFRDDADVEVGTRKADGADDGMA